MNRSSIAWLLALPLALASPQYGLADTADPGVIPDPVTLLPDTPPRGAVVLFSDIGGWTARDARMAKTLRTAGAAVIGVDLRSYLSAIDGAAPDCVYMVSDIEERSHQAQRAAGGDAYHPPVVAGIGVGGALARDILAQTPDATLGGAIAVDPAPLLPLKTPLCTTNAHRITPAGAEYDLPAGPLPAPLTVIETSSASAQGRARIDALAHDGARFERRASSLEAGDALTEALDAALGAKAESPLGLPVIELPAAATRDTLAVVVSGDGGWRDLDETIGGILQTRGVPTVGLDSLRYFWSARTPRDTARDLARIISHYAGKWGVRRVLLVGYSFGADILPETYLALDAATRARIAQISLLGLSRQADWEITVAGWLGGVSASARPTGPALAALPLAQVQCFHGRDEEDSACPALSKGGAELVQTAGGHHFDGDYEALADRILTGLDHRLAKMNPAPVEQAGLPATVPAQDRQPLE